MKIRPFFAWYDLWIGAYIDAHHRTIYICPIPMFGIEIQLRRHDDQNRRQASDPHSVQTLAHAAAQASETQGAQTPPRVPEAIACAQNVVAAT